MLTTVVLAAVSVVILGPSSMVASAVDVRRQTLMFVKVKRSSGKLLYKANYCTNNNERPRVIVVGSK